MGVSDLFESQRRCSRKEDARAAEASTCCGRRNRGWIRIKPVAICDVANPRSVVLDLEILADNTGIEAVLVA